MAESRLKRLTEQRNTLNARIKREQNKLRGKERRDDTRRKVLAGAAVLEWAAKDSSFAARLMAELRVFLVRDIDRALFDLAALEKHSSATDEAAERKSA